MKKARDAVKASIDRGVPAQYGSEEDGLIVGYQKDGEEWICYHPLKKGGKETFIETSWPWGIAVFTERKAEQPDRRALAVTAMKLAVEMASADDVEEYTLGARAWDVWLAKLRELESADQETRSGSMMGNSWIYGTLVEYRSHAARYLRSVATLFDEEAPAHLRSAADRYEQMATKVLTGEDKCPLDVAPAPWSLKEGQEWTTQRRADQIRRLEAARPLEQAALREVELALAAIE